MTKHPPEKCGHGPRKPIRCRDCNNPRENYLDVVQSLKGANAVPEEHREEVAAELRRRWAELRLNLEGAGLKLLEEDGDTDRREMQRTLELGVLAELQTDAGPMFWQDAVLADYLESFGADGAELAEMVRTDAVKRWGSGAASGHANERDYLWSTADDDFWLTATVKIDRRGRRRLFWNRPSEAPACEALKLLAVALWRDTMQPVLYARKHTVSRVVVGRDHYIRVPRAGSAISWTMGGPGRVIEVDGDRYVPSGKLVACIVPRSWEIVHKAAARPPAHQWNLPIQLPKESGRMFVAVAVEQVATAAGLRGSLLAAPPLAGKVLVELFSTIPEADTVSCSLRDLAREIYPGQTLRDRHFKGAAEGLLFCKALQLMMPDGTGISCFDVRTPLDPEAAHPNQVITWSLGKLFQALGSTPEGKVFNGWFLLNKSGFMRLDNRIPRLQAHYIRAAASWNDAHDRSGNFNPERVEPCTLEAWGRQTNTLSQRTTEFLRGQGKDQRRKLSDDRKAVESDLEALAAEDCGLIRLERVGRGRVRILPPDTYLEAWEKARRGGFVTPRS